MVHWWFLFKRWQWQYCPEYAITIPFASVEATSLPIATSAQQVELYTLTQACTLVKNKTANIYADSRYTFRVIHDFGLLKKQHGFLTSRGNEIKNGPMFRNYSVQYFYLSFSYYWFCGILNLTLWKLKEITLLIFLQGMLPLKGPTTARLLL